MKARPLLCGIAVLASTLAAGQCPAALLASWHDLQYGSVTGECQSARIEWEWSAAENESSENLPPPALLFAGRVIRPSDNTQTLIATASTDPGFAAVSQFLSNGQDDLVSLGVTFDSGSGVMTGQNESGWSGGMQPWDTSGYLLEQIEMDVTTFSLINTGGRTEYRYEVSLRLIGSAVPEPASLMLSGIGAGLLMLGRRRRPGSVRVVHCQRSDLGWHGQIGTPRWPCLQTSHAHPGVPA